MARIPLARLQLTREKRRLFAALAGIAFAVILMLMQMGFRDALFSSSTLLHERMHCDLVLLSPQYEYIVISKPFTIRRLYQALAFEGVESIAPFYVSMANWKNPETLKKHTILALGVDPRASAFDLPGVAENLDKIQLPDRVLFDVKSRREFGPIVEQFRQGHSVFTEISGRRIEVAGLYELGSSFGANGNIITSDLNFLRLFPNRQRDLIDIGLIRVRPGVDPEKVRARMAETLLPDVKVLTRDQFIELEHKFWEENSPVGFIFTMGTLMGLVVGTVIVYQILYTDVSDHLKEYATLKAMGYPDLFLFRVVLEEAIILSILGFIPGLLLAHALYRITRNATSLPIDMTIGRVLAVLILTVVMCVGSGALAMRRLKAADPADIF
jgi:putative ABC transport system permease protein